MQTKIIKKSETMDDIELLNSELPEGGFVRVARKILTCKNPAEGGYEIYFAKKCSSIDEEMPPIFIEKAIKAIKKKETEFRKNMGDIFYENRKQLSS